LRGREQIAELTVRLRNEHNEYESASQSWSPEASEKKRELRKARADTLVEIAAALTWIGERERLQEIERLPIEQKLAQLEAFLGNTTVASAAPSPDRNGLPAAIPHAEAPSPVARPQWAVAAGAAQESPRAERRSTRPSTPPVSLRPVPLRPAPLRPMSTRPASRRPIGYWPMRLASSARPRAGQWKVPLLMGVITVQGLAVVVLSLAALRAPSRCSESEPSRAPTSHATAAAMAAPPLPPPATQPASPAPSEPPAAARAIEPRPVAVAQTAKRAGPAPHPPARSKPPAAPSLPVLAGRSDTTFVPDTL
jgi:hypothetical protein